MRGLLCGLLDGAKSPLVLSRRDVRASSFSVRAVTDVTTTFCVSTSVARVFSVVLCLFPRASIRISRASKRAASAVQRDMRVSTALRKAITSAESDGVMV